MMSHQQADLPWSETELLEAPLPDHGFTARTMQRIARHRRRRRRLSMAGGVAVGSSVAAMFAAAGSDVGSLLDPTTLASGLLLAALMAACWIGTETPATAFVPTVR